MATAHQIKALLKSHTRGDDEHFLTVALQIAANEARRGHTALALEIKKLVEDATSRQSSRATSNLMVMARPQGDARLSRKEKFIHLARRVGYGVPDLDRALYCAAQRATMVAQAMLQPYRKDKDGVPKLHEMNLYALPWPGDVFRKFSDCTIRLRVTLSYFIEPNPPKVGTVNSNYNYAGCALRFAISKLGQTRKAFEAEINALADADDSQSEADPGDNLRWRFGQKGRSKGSLHCDVWEGPAAALIEPRYIGVHPVSGWWKTRPFKHRYNEKIRYALLVSLESDSPNIDIYTPLRVAVETTVPIPT